MNGNPVPSRPGWRSIRKKRASRKDKSYEAKSASKESQEDDDSLDKEEIAYITREAVNKIPATT